MLTAKLTLAFTLSWNVVSVSAAHGDDYAKTMGPVAFLWPPDREWGAAQDNTPPCGSASGVVNRTQFPMMNGQMALVIQDESWNVQVGISYNENPTSNSDFETIIAGARISDVDEGHECYAVPNPSADIEQGTNATLQIRYTSDFDTDKNETFYACADITYILTSQFTYQVPCFNASVDDFGLANTSDPTATSSAGPAATASLSTSTSSTLSGGAIAGIVIGCVCGAAIALWAFFLFWRRRQQKERLRQQEASLRTAKWDDSMEGSGTFRGQQGSNVMLWKLH